MDQIKKQNPVLLFMFYMTYYNMDSTLYCSDRSKIRFLSEYKTKKSCVLLFFGSACRVLSILQTKQTRNPTKWGTQDAPCNRLQFMFSTFSSCFEMPVMSYHSLIHGLDLFIC